MYSVSRLMDYSAGYSKRYSFKAEEESFLFEMVQVDAFNSVVTISL